MIELERNKGKLYLTGKDERLRPAHHRADI